MRIKEVFTLKSIPSSYLQFLSLMLMSIPYIGLLSNFIH